ncbi:hypothetical protein TcBrA4_0100260 [Trypanosoma cruzi]|nr:hypothetical protein TcBrA4_0100260 [Trypanosoma cruzi]
MSLSVWWRRLARSCVRHRTVSARPRKRPASLLRELAARRDFVSPLLRPGPPKPRLQYGLSSALKTLEQLAEERETLARGSAELEERVRELEQELRDAQTAHDVDSSDGLTLREQLAAAHAAIDQLSAERSAQAERVAELTAAVARLESSADVPERVVEALSAELRETQDRLRQAEEEAGQLAERIGSSEGLCESAVATRSAKPRLQRSCRLR